MTRMSREQTVLLEPFRTEREHVLTAVECLGEERQSRVAAPSGWSLSLIHI